MNFITYEDKKTLQEHPEIDEVNKVTADNMNQIKKGINIIYNKTNGDSTMTEQGTSITLNNTLNAPLKNIEFYGDTSQDGTPTPDNPIEINSVTGGQVVSICGKNLFDKSTIKSGYLIQVNGNEVANASYGASDFIPVKANTQYVRVNCNNYYGAFYDINKNFVGAIQNANVITPSVDGYVRISFLLTNVDSVQLEKGSTAADYEEYKGQSYEINLGKNLLNIPDETYSNNGITAVVSNGIITLNGTASGTSFIGINVVLSLSSGTYSLSLNNSDTKSDTGTYVRFANDAGSVLAYVNTNASRNIILSSSTTYSQLVIRTTSGISFDNFVIKPQLEKSLQATSYSSYFTPIELNKIGNYEDRIYKDSGKWYLEKNIGKVVLDGSENWQKLNNVTYNTYYVNNLISANRANNTAPYLSNYFTEISTNQRYVDKTFFLNADNRITISYDDITSVADFKTWLSTHNTEVYYILATPTTTEITDTTLINQLNNIYNANTYKEKTEISVDGNLPSILDITAYTNTLNGIHESLNDRLTTLSNS